MKKIVLVTSIVIVTFVASLSFGGTTITGSYGYFTVPTPKTDSKGYININTGYIFSPGNFYLSFNAVPINNLEISAAKEVLTYQNSGGMKYTPYILGAKYTFYGSGGSLNAALGIQFEFVDKEVGLPGIPITIYGVVSESAGKLGNISTGLGYTLGINAGYNINFMLGLEKAIIGNQLYFIGEFTNFSVRQGYGLPWNVNRGIFNAGLLLKLNKLISFKLVGYDLFDHFITVSLGGELRLKGF